MRLSMGTNFTPLESVLLAVAEDDVEKFEKACAEIGFENILNHTFEHGMNVLNLAIDQESEQIV